MVTRNDDDDVDGWYVNDDCCHNDADKGGIDGEDLVVNLFEKVIMLAMMEGMLI